MREVIETCLWGPGFLRSAFRYLIGYLSYYFSVSCKLFHLALKSGNQYAWPFP